MEKKVFDIGGADKICKEIEMKIGDHTVTVRDHLSFDERSEMAEEIASMSTMINDDDEVIMVTHMIDVIYAFEVVKFYTNVDTTDLTPDVVFDWVVNNGAMNELMDIVAEDLAYVTAMADQMMDNVIAVYEKQHSLGTAIRKSFGFLFSGEDITETLAQSQGLSEQMIDTLEKLKEANKKPTEGKLNVGGNILNIAKKKTK